MRIRKGILRILAQLPGAAGILLRQRSYPRLLAHCGRKGLFGHNIQFLGEERINLGTGVVVGDNVVLQVDTNKKENSIFIENDVFLGTGTTILALNGPVRIGQGTSLGSFCSIRGDTFVTIGAETLFAAYCEVGSAPFNAAQHSQCKKTVPLPTSTGITVGKGCWLGVRSRILPEAGVGDGCIVGAHAVICQDLAPLSVAVGDPAYTLYMRTKKANGCP